MKPEDIERVKDLLPTSLGSEEIRREIAADLLRRSVFSARIESARYLAKVRDVCADISAGKINAADARAQLLAVLGQMGHSPQDEGGLRNPASIRRLNLILDTQTQMASSVATLSEQTDATLYQWPAWELTRMETRAVPRTDWLQRWTAAGNSVGWNGALKRSLIALKSSPIWQALGDGAGGFKDTLGNPFPPFAYSSGMNWREVDRETCEKLGLLNPGSPAATPERPSLSPGEKDIADAIARYGFHKIAEGLA